MLNSIEDLKKFINDKNFKKIFLLCGKKSFLTSGAEKLIKKIMINKNIKIFYKNSELPVLDELIVIINTIRNFKPNLILAIGGGAVIDYAKTANVVDVRPDLANLIINYSFPFKKKYSKLAVIPTTAGSGAEVTSNAVIYVEGIKHSFESKLLIPDYFFLIPEFLISAPKNIKASAGFDAIAQALESLISKKSNDQSIDFALKSLKISTQSFISFLDKPDIKNATEMSIAANLAGKAINISKTTVPHAVSYPFTSIYNLSHGHAVSLFFEKFFKFNYYYIKKSETDFNLNDRFNLIFNLFNVRNIDEFCSKIISIKKKSFLEDNLLKLNINVKNDFNEIVKGINLLRLGNNPIKICEKNILEVITNGNN